MARNDTLKMADALERAFSSQEVLKGTGSLSFVRSDRRGSATIYLTKGKVEAIEASGYASHLLQRVTSLQLLSPENHERVITRFAKQPNSLLVANFMRELMMIEESELIKLIKEHFLGALDEILTWEISNFTWKTESAQLDLTMPLVSPDNLLKVGLQRQRYLQETADGYGVSVAQLSELTFRQVAELEEPSEDETEPDINQQTMRLILSVGTGEYNILDLQSRFGLPVFKGTQLLKLLWQARTVDLMFKEFPILHPSQQVEDQQVEADAEQAAGFTTEGPEQSEAAPVVPAVVEAAQPTAYQPEAESEAAPEPAADEDDEPVLDHVSGVDQSVDEEPDYREDSPFIENAVDEAILATSSPDGDVHSDIAGAANTATPNQVSFEQFEDEDIIDIASPDRSDEDDVEGEVSPTVAAAVAVAQDAEPAEAADFQLDTSNPLGSIRTYIQTLRESIESTEQDVAGSDAEEARVLQVIAEHQEYLQHVREDRAAAAADRDRLKQEHAELIDYLKQL
jgi:hypothetical protein